jgi:hypothetical protein
MGRTLSSLQMLNSTQKNRSTLFSASMHSNTSLRESRLVDTVNHRYRDRTDLRLIDSVGKNLLQVIRNKAGILEHMEGLFEFYDQGLGLDMANRHMARLIAQVGHRYPRMKLLEIGK